MKDRIKDEPLCAHFSDNHRIRFLVAYLFDVEAAVQAMISAERYRIENNWKNITKSDIQIVTDKGFAFTYGHDKDGRAIYYQRLKNFKLGDITPYQAE